MSTILIIYIILAFVIAVVIAGFQYVSAIRKKEKASILLAFLRFCTIFLIAILFINPTIDQSELKQTKPALVVAIDNSKSIANFNEEQPIREVIESLQSNDALNEKFNIDFYEFGTDIKPLDTLSFSSSNTGISRALSQLKSLYKDENAPIVLISDGNQTLGSSYEYLGSNQPIFTLVAGDTLKYEDLSITQLNVNRFTYLENKFPVEAYVNYSGSNELSQQFSVYLNDKRVFSEKLNFNENQTSRKVSFYLEASKVGLHYYSAEISPLSSEKNTENNKRSFAVEVIDEQSKTLVLSSFLHPDLGSLKESIEQNKQRKVEIKVIGESLELEEYQSVILYQPTQAFASVFESLKLMKLSYGVITGSKTDWNFLNSVQTNFEKNAINQTENYRALLNPGFTTFNVTNLDVQSFPPLVDKFGSVNFNFDADVLMWQQVGDIVQETPLLATFEDAASKKFLLLGEGIWRWRMASYLSSNSFEYYDTFIGKMIQYLSASGSKKRLMVNANPLYYLSNSSSIKASFLNKNYELDTEAALWLELRNKDNNELKRIPFSLSGNSYNVSLRNVTEGEYDYVVSVESQDEKFRGTFRMLNSDIESQFKSANVQGMKGLSKRSNGSFYTLNNATELINALNDDNRFRPTESIEIRSKSFMEWQWLLGLIILSLSIEWFIRKYNGLI